MKSHKKYGFFLLALLAASSLTSLASNGSSWVSVGPDGGDARSFTSAASNPRHLYLGTTSSWVYESVDGGSSWKRLSKVANQDDLVLDSMVVDASDPKTIFVGAWVVDHPDGGLFVSHDAGATWAPVADMRGQSIRALSQAQ